MATPLSSPSALAYDMDKLTNISTSSLVGLAIGFYAVYVLGTWIYNVYFHPLRNVPGPWLAAATPMWLMVVDLTFQKSESAVMCCPDVPRVLIFFSLDGLSSQGP